MAGGLLYHNFPAPGTGYRLQPKKTPSPAQKQVPSSSTSAWNTAQAQRTRRITTRLFFCPPLDFLPFLRLAFLTLAFFIFSLSYKSLARSKKKKKYAIILLVSTSLPCKSKLHSSDLLCLSIFFNLLVNLPSTCLAIPPQVTYYY